MKKNEPIKRLADGSHPNIPKIDYSKPTHIKNSRGGIITIYVDYVDTYNLQRIDSPICSFFSRN